MHGHKIELKDDEKDRLDELHKRKISSMTWRGFSGPWGASAMPHGA
jgi:hypothetical protein